MMLLLGQALAAAIVVGAREAVAERGTLNTGQEPD
jgi:hypothetical protein